MPPIKVHIWIVKRPGDPDLEFETREDLEAWIQKMIPPQITNSEHVTSGNGKGPILHVFTITGAPDVYPREIADFGPKRGTYLSNK